MKITLYAKLWVGFKGKRNPKYDKYIVDLQNRYVQIFKLNVNKNIYEYYADLFLINSANNGIINSTEFKWDRSDISRCGTGVENILLNNLTNNGVGYWSIINTHTQSIIYANILFSKKPFDYLIGTTKWENYEDPSIKKRLRELRDSNV